MVILKGPANNTRPVVCEISTENVTKIMIEMNHLNTA
jgi:hypothetical protein